MLLAPFLLCVPPSPAQQSQHATVSIMTPDAIDLARAIASDEGFDVKRSSIYSVLAPIGPGAATGGHR